MKGQAQRDGLQGFAPADRMQGLVVVASFCFWAMVLGLVPGLAIRTLLAG